MTKVEFEMLLMHFTGRTLEAQESIFKSKIIGIRQLKIWLFLDVALYADDFRSEGRDAV